MRAIQTILQVVEQTLQNVVHAGGASLLVGTIFFGPAILSLIGRPAMITNVEVDEAVEMRIVTLPPVPEPVAAGTDEETASPEEGEPTAEDPGTTTEAVSRKIAAKQRKLSQTTEVEATAAASTSAATTDGSAFTGHMTRPGSSGANKDSKRHTRRKCDDPTQAIAQTSDSSWSVERDLVEYYTSSMSALRELGWVKRHRGTDGKADGFMVRGIRCGSPLHQAGFRNGDVIHEVNGKKVTSVPQVITAYRKLKKKDAVRVRLSRKGAGMKLTYRIS